MAVRNGNNQTPSKSAKIIEKYIRESGEDYTGSIRENVNWATGEEVEALSKPTTMDYFNEVRNKRTSPISDVEIVIERHQKALNLIFRNSLSIRDMGNPLYGEEDRSTRKNLSQNIMQSNPSENKVCVIYGGDLLGNEWELKRLNNAKIITQSTMAELKQVASDVIGSDKVDEMSTPEVIRKALFYALGEKVKVLKRDVAFALKHNVDVYLLNGAQEEKINKYFKIDVIATIVKDLEKSYPGKIHYIKGVNTIVNVVKQTGSAPRYATIGFLTNNSLSKARQGQQAVSGVKMNSGENSADVVFVTNTNVAGKKGTREYYVSGESTYMTIAQKKMPVLSPKHYNTFSLRIPATQEITVIEGLGVPQPNPFEMQVYRELCRQEAIKEVILEGIEETLNTVTAPAKTDPVKTMQHFYSRNVSSAYSKPATPMETAPVVVEEAVPPTATTVTQEENRSTQPTTISYADLFDDVDDTSTIVDDTSGNDGLDPM